MMALVALAIAATGAAAQDSAAPLDELLQRGLNDETFDAWKSRILPRAEELRWLAIPWRLTLREGLEEARKSGKPVLLWAMNGHPFACT